MPISVSLKDRACLVVGGGPAALKRVESLLDYDTAVTVVATVDPDGAPHTAPFGSLRAVTPRLLRLACNHHHDTYANLRRDGQVSVVLLASPNIAVSIRGRARLVKERIQRKKSGK